MGEAPRSFVHPGPLVVSASFPLAQAPLYSEPFGSGPYEAQHGDVPVKIITQDDEKAEFIIYSAVVTAAFLNRFAFPSKAPAVTDIQGHGLNINLIRVQIWPVLGLKERLAKALGPEIAGDLALKT